MIRFNVDELKDFNEMLSREWLETNGLGGFASSTPYGLNTRRYHGLLVAATHPPVGRMVLLSKFEEAVIIDGQRYELSSNQYPGSIYPQGHDLLTEFRLDPFPIFTYAAGGLTIEKSLFMIDGENSVVVQYRVVRERRAFESPAPLARRIELELRPLLAFRDYHSLAHENDSINRDVSASHRLLMVKPYAQTPALYLAHDAYGVERAAYWYRDFEYRAERERGFDFHEDLYSPFRLLFDLSAGRQASVIASTEPRDVLRADNYRLKEIERRRRVVERTRGEDRFLQSLVAAADQFIVARGDCKTIIAGYHWFADWGRDTMIALPGLTLLTGRPDVARNTLREFARHVDKGMLPNRFPDAGEEPEYNTVDATLWFFEAVRAFLDETQDYEFVRVVLYNVLIDIMDWHERGTRYNIRVDRDGLLQAGGAEGVQLTWMDARVGSRVITPRRGKPVEIQALWYNALCVMEELARKFKDMAGELRFHEMALMARTSFNRLFWNEEANCLYDVIGPDGPDPSLRPNQILAVSLRHTMLPYDKARRVVEAVREKLLTPYGLRSLSPEDAQYAAAYTGGPEERDAKYHQGTVWPWLMGPFIEAYMKVHGETREAREQASRWLVPFEEHLRRAGLGSVSEIFDAEEPYIARGCVAQAWSVAELLRAAVMVRSAARLESDEYAYEGLRSPEPDLAIRTGAQP